MTAQFTAKTTNSEKAIYFLPLMSCSINKLKPQMFLERKNFMFSYFAWKKTFAPGNGGGAGTPCPPPCSLLSTTLKEASIWNISMLIFCPVRIGGAYLKKLKKEKQNIG